MTTPADQKSIDLPDLQRRTIQQARIEAAIPMKNEPGIFDRLGEGDRQQAATISANIPDWTTPGMMRPFATDSQKDAENENPPLVGTLTRDARIALNVPQAFLVGSSLGGGVPGWINGAKSNGAPFSGIGKRPGPAPAIPPQPHPTFSSLYPAPAPSQPSSLATTAGNPRLTPFDPTPDPTQPSSRRRGLFPAAGGSQ
jgi:hypothetical protein